MITKTCLLGAIKKRTVEILIGALIILLFLAHLKWVADNDLLIYEEDREHVPKAVFYYKHMDASFGDFSKAFFNTRSNYSYWPLVRTPLIYIITGAINLLFGFSVFKMQVAFFVFFLMLIVSTYLIGKIITNKEVGLLSAVFMALNPLVVHYSHIYNQDLPLAAMVNLGLYFLLLNDNFKSVKNALCLGVVFGLGVLTKPTFIVYLALPLVVCLFSAFKQYILELKLNKERYNAKILINTMLFGVIFFAAGWSWYGGNLRWLLPNCQVEFFVNKGLNKFANPMLYYAIGFYEECGVVLFLLAFFSVLVVARMKNNFNKLFVLFLISSFLFLLLISNKQMRFALPIMPAVAIVSAIGIWRIEPLLIRKPLISIVLLVLCAQLICSSFFCRTGTSFLAKARNALLVKCNRLPQQYWDLREGKQYSRLFEAEFKKTSEEHWAEKISWYFRLSGVHDYKIRDNCRLSLKEAFKQYLLFKRPDLLINHLSDKELALLFVGHES